MTLAQQCKVLKIWGGVHHMDPTWDPSHVSKVVHQSLLNKYYKDMFEPLFNNKAPLTKKI
jgi:hypothetical protein